MELQKIKIGQTYNYVSRKNDGRGKVTDIETKTTGAWITIHDKGKDKSFVVRPSQIGVTPETYVRKAPRLPVKLGAGKPAAKAKAKAAR